MAIKVGGTEVITNGLELSNIASIDATTVTALESVITTDPTLGTLTKSFASGETASVSLSSSVSPTAVVAVTKEIGQTGVSSKGAWDVNATSSNYELYTEAPATSLSLEGWDISSVLLLQSFSVSSQDTTPLDIFFKTDGTKMYVLGNVGDDVNEYNLSTAWDVSTASYSQNFSVAAQETTPRGIFFKPDGTKMYIVGESVDAVNEYSLSTAWDVSTTSYVQNISVATQENQPRDLFFKPDGTKFYVVGVTSDAVNEYSLSTAWDISTASYVQNISVATEDTSPTGIFFKPDGTKMYIVGSVGDDVNEYSLSTAWDVSTASYVQNFSVATQETSPAGIFFKPDGTKMYIVGSVGDDVNEYDVSGVSSLGTGSFAPSDVGKRIFVDDGGEAILTATDGSYSLVSAFGASSYTSGNWSLSGLDVDATNGITLSGGTPINTWSLSSGTYIQNFSVATEATAPQGIFFKPDGTKMYIVGSSLDAVNEYNLSAAWNVSTASYVQRFYVSTQETSPAGIFFKPDGTKMYIVGYSGDDVNEYSLNPAWNVSTASYVRNFSVSAQDLNPKGIFFKSDGKKMYILGDSGNDVNEYSLSTGWNISTASYVQRFSVGSQETTPTGIFFKPDGTKMYVVGTIGVDVNEYSLSTAWDVSTASYNLNFSVSAQETSPQGVFFKPDGTRMYIVGATGDEVNEYKVGTFAYPIDQYNPAITSIGGQIDSTYWTDINSMTADDADNDGEVYYAVSTDDRTTWSIAKDSDGVRNIVRNNGGTWEYNSAETLVNPWGITTGSLSQSFDTSSQDSITLGLTFKPDGTKMYTTGFTNDSVYEYNLSTAFDVSTASYVQSLSVSSQETNPRGIVFKPDGTKMYISGDASDAVQEYNLSTAWDISTAVFSQSFSTLSQVTTTYDLFFKPDGTRFYVVDLSNKDVSQYNLSTAWDISTASYSTASISLLPQGNGQAYFFFKPDGTKMYTVDYVEDAVFEYSLSTAWDISTISYTGNSLDVPSLVGQSGIFINSEGSKLFVTGTNGTDNFVYEFKIGEQGFTTSETWNSATTNNEFAALAEALGATTANQMNKAQIDAVTDGSHFTLGDTLDLAVIPYITSGGVVPPTSDGLLINYDAAALNKGAILGTDYDYDVPAGDVVRIKSLSAQNLKVRIV